MALRAQEAPGPGEEGPPRTASARPAACESVLLQRGNGHRTVRKGRHPEPRVMSIPLHWTRRTQLTGLGQKRNQEVFLHFEE